MTRLVLHSRVGWDGVLHVTVPLGEQHADRVVQVTIDPAGVGTSSLTYEQVRALRQALPCIVPEASFVGERRSESQRREELP
jgi:hypothetical protein